MAIETYQVIAATGVVIDDAGQSIFYPAGSVFQGNTNNPSIVSNLASQRIIRASGASVPPPPAPAVGGGVGPTGPTGPPGGPAGSVFSVKIRTAPFTFPLTLNDTGGNVVISWPA
jgi:hypothetical protein